MRPQITKFLAQEEKQGILWTLTKFNFSKHCRQRDENGENSPLTHIEVRLEKSTIILLKLFPHLPM